MNMRHQYPTVFVIHQFLPVTRAVTMTWIHKIRRVIFVSTNLLISLYIFEDFLCTHNAYITSAASFLFDIFLQFSSV